MSLSLYKAKRNFEQTSEPKGKKVKASSKKLSFVVQKHDARRLHYDLRLEVGGVLKSWAVPKGPSLDPSVKRLAIEVEDHPLEYGSFEGTIPKGSYGAGDVIVWDKGTYTPDGIKGSNEEKGIEEALRKGKLTFHLNGKKLKGEFSLVRLAKESKQPEWLLIKKNDEYGSNEDVTDNEKSVLSNKSIKKSVKKQEKVKAVGKKKAMPHNIRPMLGSLIEKPFDKEGWLFEAKWDGFRAIAEIESQRVKLYSRNLLSFNEKFPEIVHALQKLKKKMVLDGEIVMLDAKGIPRFQLLQNYLSTIKNEGTLCYCLFDILYYDGYDLTGLPLLQRKEILQEVLEGAPKELYYSDHIEKNGIEFFAEAKKRGLEGIVAKEIDSLYIQKRSKSWLKIKTHERQEVVVGGFTEPRNSRKHLGALLVGYYENNEFIYAGHVGGGFNSASLKQMYDLLEPLIVEKSPFKTKPKANTKVTWVRPKIVVEASFQEWTKDNIMRQPVFEGIREDKKPKEVHLEKPLGQEEVKEELKKPEPSAKGENLIQELISNPTKIYWPKEKITKEELLRYYEEVSPYLLPHLMDRPLVMHRFPNGITGQSFFQKDAGDSRPDWIQTVTVQHVGKKVPYILANDLKTLLYVANLGSIELHPFLSKVPTLNDPDFLVIDLDPSGLSFQVAVEVAKEVHKIFESLKVPHYCKLSGKRGIHIYLPLGAKYPYEAVETLAKLLANVIHEEIPEETSLVRDPAKRQKKVYIDYLQNGWTKTVVAPYSVRPVPGACVAAPVEWKEVKAGLEPTDFTLVNMPARLKKKGDLFKPLLKESIAIDKLLKTLEKNFP